MSPMAPPPNARGGPRPPAQDRHLTDLAAPVAAKHPRLSRAIVADPARELQAWAMTVKHLHSLGLPAGGVPEFAAAWLRRQGICPDWETAA